MKTIAVSAIFPDLPARCAEQSARARATSIPTGAARALRAILARPELRRRRIKTLRLYLKVSNP